jgi:hypothetical protein
MQPVLFSRSNQNRLLDFGEALEGCTGAHMLRRAEGHPTKMSWSGHWGGPGDTNQFPPAEKSDYEHGAANGANRTGAGVC